MPGLLKRETNKKAGIPSREIRTHHGDDRVIMSEPEFDHAAGRYRCHEDLSQAVASQIIPRLLVACRGDQPLPARGPLRISGAKAFVGVEDFATLLLNQNEVEISDCLFNLCEQGASIEWLYLELMTRAARHIGFLWEEDRCSMVDVTLALGSLQQIVHQYSPVFQRQSLPTDRRRRALLLPAFGEQHTFGLSLVMEFFRREGWDLWSWPMLQEQELLSLLRNEWFAVVGITVGAEVNLAGLSALIRDLRRVSANRSLGIMVGGPIVLKYPHLARDLGADATGVDAHQAVLQAESLLNLQ